jgi:hypothetical protein
MARARNIKPGFFTNDDLVDLPFEVRILFIGLWTIADKEGRLVDRPKKIKMEIFPADNVDCDNALSLLAGKGFVRRYQVGGVGYVQIINWAKHQSPHIKESPSVIPAENEVAPEIPVQAPVNAQPKPERAGLIPDSLNLIPDSLNPPPLEAIESAKPPRQKKASSLPEDFSPTETGIAYAVTRRLSLETELASFRNWHQAKGTTMKDWQAAWRTWCDKAVEFGRAGQQGGGGARASPAANSRDEGRRKVLEVLTGGGRNEQRSERDITGEAVRIAG